jgi:hypothetical protein
MCRRVTCRSCGKPGWSGCGAHVDAVLADVPPDDRCRCDEVRAEALAAARTERGERKGFLHRLLGG